MDAENKTTTLTVRDRQAADHTKPLRDMYDATCRALGRARAEVDDLEAETERQRLVLIELGDTAVA